DGQAKDTEKGGWLVPKIGIVTGPLQSGVASFDINCRCRVRGQVKGYPPTKRTYRDENDNTVLGEYKTYKEWKAEQISNKPIKINKKSNNVKRNYDSILAKKIGSEHYDKVHDIIDKCPNEKLKRVWEKYEKDINIGKTNYTGTPHYSPMKENINFNLNLDAKGNKSSTKYQTLFHESGHAIDSRIAKDKKSIVRKYVGYSNGYKDGIFPDTLEKEINGILLRYENEILKEMEDHITDYKWLADRKYMDYFDYQKWVNKGIKPRKPRYKKRFAYNKLRIELKQIPIDEVGNISDIIDGATYGKVNANIGHGTSYWNKHKDFLTDRNNGLGKEAFAEMFDATFVNEKNLNMIKKYVPKSYEIFLKMIEEI
ncbi:MAG: hypothetical protein Q7K36_07315, partial [Fusobacterium sp. JB020]|nr:hypothetical protein [Fusobacterium sp. JB020]